MGIGTESFIRAWTVLVLLFCSSWKFRASPFSPPLERRHRGGPLQRTLALYQHEYSIKNGKYDEKETYEVLLQETNKERRRVELNELQMNDQLSYVAQQHAQDMAKHDYFSHTSLHDGTRSSDRVLQRTNYRFQAVGENLYFCFSNNLPHEAVAGWMNSTGHRENILGQSFQDIGLGYAVSYQHQKHYYVQIFANPLLTPAVQGPTETLQRLLHQANLVRRQAGLSDLSTSLILEQLAQQHAWEMMELDDINIPCRCCVQQMKMDGFQQMSFQSSFREPFNDPFAAFSDNRDKNVLLQPEFTVVGFGYANRGERNYYMMILGFPSRSQSSWMS